MCYLWGRYANIHATYEMFINDVELLYVNNDDDYDDNAMTPQPDHIRGLQWSSTWSLTTTIEFLVNPQLSTYFQIEQMRLHELC